jgi:DNA-binding transcriptional MerR regulator
LIPETARFEEEHMVDKSPDAFRTISEVADDLALPQHVLRFWETRFPQIKPLKRGGGRRYYRPDDVALITGLKTLLYGHGYTIKGVQRILKEQGAKSVQAVGRGEALPASMPQPMAADSDSYVEPRRPAGDGPFHVNAPGSQMARESTHFVAADATTEQGDMAPGGHVQPKAPKLDDQAAETLRRALDELNSAKKDLLRALAAHGHR